MNPLLDLQLVKLDTRANSATSVNTASNTTEESTLTSGATAGALPQQEANIEYAKSAFHTSFLTTHASRTAELENAAHQEVVDLSSTVEFQLLVEAAQKLSHLKGLSIEESTERLIMTFNRLNHAWNSITLSQGLKTLVSLKNH